jgi:hypothetical protein
VKWGLGLWFLLIGLLVAYVIADGFFDLSNKIRSWARPLWRAAWGAVVGGARKRAAPAAPVTGHVGTASADSGSHMDQSAPVQTPPNNPIRLPSIAAVFAWFWKWKAPILALAAFLFVFSLMRGCSIPFIGKSRDTLQAELKVERANVAVAEHEARLAQRAGELALETEQDARRVDRVIAQAEQEIEDAVEADDFDRLYDAYRRAYGSVWDDLGEGRPDPDAGGPERVRGSGGLAA